MRTLSQWKAKTIPDDQRQTVLRAIAREAIAGGWTVAEIQRLVVEAHQQCAHPLSEDEILQLLAEEVPELLS